MKNEYILKAIRSNGGGLGFTRYTEQWDDAMELVCDGVLEYRDLGQYDVCWFTIKDDILQK